MNEHRAPARTADVRAREPRFFRGGGLGPERGATRVSAYIYGDILVLAALVALHPDDLEGSTGLAYVVGTAVSTYVAHVLAESVGHSTREQRPVPRDTIRHELRDALPIASAALGPAALMAGALLGWWSSTAALMVSIAFIVCRLAATGWVVGYLRGERASLRTFLAGFALAGVCLLVAILKWWLTH